MRSIPESFKRPWRENAVTGPVYMRMASGVSRCRIFLFERLGGRRYYSARHFDRLFEARTDPWRYAGDPVALERRALILSHLPRLRYPRLLEIGSAEGWMTKDLANRSERLFALDVSEVALRRARRYCADVPGVQFIGMDLLHSCLSGTFDGIVCAGVLVFLPRLSQEQIRDDLVSLLKPGGDLVLEHTREASHGEVPGREIHALFGRAALLTQTAHTERDRYAISVFRKRTCQ